MRNNKRPLTGDFSEYLVGRMKSDPGLRRERLTGAVEAIVNGQVDDAKLALRDYVKATIGFEALGQAIGKKSESVKRMLSPTGNPTLANLVLILECLKAEEGVTFAVEAAEPDSDLVPA